jgi:hypothetical protein
MSIASRLAALEQHAKGGGLTVVTVHGGLPDYGLNHAQAGGYSWTRDPLESEEDFAETVGRHAVANREPVLVLGGLPPPIS